MSIAKADYISEELEEIARAEREQQEKEYNRLVQMGFYVKAGQKKKIDLLLYKSAAEGKRKSISEWLREAIDEKLEREAEE